MFTTARSIEWGDCDAAGIVFYPSFFRWMDAAFHAFTRSEGFDQKSLLRDFGVMGTPLVDARCRFLAPGRFYDDLAIALSVRALGRSSVTLAYRFSIGDTVIAEGEEIRAFVAKVDGGALRKAEIPEPIRRRLEPHLDEPEG